jgi:hypothetical protein
VLVQVAFESQPPLLVAHSFTSAQVTPSPVKPLLQVQVRLPSVFAHAALAEHPPLLVAHSSMSTHWPLSRRYPAVQVKPQLADAHVATECTGCGHEVQRLPHEVTASSFTHCWPHACWPAGQAQVPEVHVAPMGQSLVRRQPVRQRLLTGSQK